MMCQDLFGQVPPNEKFRLVDSNQMSIYEAKARRALQPHPH